MKKTTIYTLSIALTLGVSSCSKETSSNSDEKDINISNLSAKIESLPKEELSVEERAGLEIMREEEGLAYQVYLKLHEKWGTKVFYNIATNGEDSHLQAMKLLLDRYAISDPYPIAQNGTFKNTTLQTLYASLVEKGSKSEIEAFKVGCEIEELDIKDLDDWVSKNDNQDLKLVYDLLNLGSRNHLRSFHKNLTNAGGTYQATHLSQERYNEIANSEKETGTY